MTENQTSVQNDDLPARDVPIPEFQEGWPTEAEVWFTVAVRATVDMPQGTVTGVRVFPETIKLDEQEGVTGPGYTALHAFPSEEERKAFDERATHIADGGDAEWPAWD